MFLLFLPLLFCLDNASACNASACNASACNASACNAIACNASATIPKNTKQPTKPIDTMLISINTLRSKHHAPPLVLDPDMSQFASDWAGYLAASGRFHHSSSRYGENIAAVRTQANQTAMYIQALTAWYNEVALYKTMNPSAQNVFNNSTGHFTALVWNNSRKVGIGLGSNSKWTIVMLTFLPGGNIPGAFLRNVFVPSQV